MQGEGWEFRRRVSSHLCTLPYLRDELPEQFDYADCADVVGMLD